MAHKQNYLEKMELNKQHRLESGLVSECFPGVSNIIIEMTYYLKGFQQASMVRTVNFWPSRHAYFNMECMIKDCDDGGFDLTSVIAMMVKKHEEKGTGELSCKGKINSRPSQHARIEYTITIQYNTDLRTIPGEKRRKKQE